MKYVHLLENTYNNEIKLMSFYFIGILRTKHLPINTVLAYKYSFYILD